MRYMFSGDERQELESALKEARTAWELRRCLSVWLPGALGLGPTAAAAALGCDASTVCHVQRRYRLRGASAFRDRALPPLPLPPGGLEALETALKRARSLEEFRRILCVALRAFFALSSPQVARAAGLPRAVVKDVQLRYRREGPAAFEPRRRQGPAAAGPPLDSDAALKLAAAMKNALSAADYERALCLYLCLALGFNTRLVARVLGWRPESVANLRRSFLRHGDEVLRAPGRGGARRRFFSCDQECAVLHRLQRQANSSGTLAFSEVQRGFEEEARHPVKPAVVEEVLRRHGWARQVVTVTAPRQALVFRDRAASAAAPETLSQQAPPRAAQPASL